MFSHFLFLLSLSSTNSLSFLLVCCFLSPLVSFPYAMSPFIYLFIPFCYFLCLCLISFSFITFSPYVSHSISSNFISSCFLSSLHLIFPLFLLCLLSYLFLPFHFLLLLLIASLLLISPYFSFLLFLSSCVSFQPFSLSNPSCLFFALSSVFLLPLIISFSPCIFPPQHFPFPSFSIYVHLILLFFPFVSFPFFIIFSCLISCILLSSHLLCVFIPPLGPSSLLLLPLQWFSFLSSTSVPFCSLSFHLGSSHLASLHFLFSLLPVFSFCLLISLSSCPLFSFNDHTPTLSHFLLLISSFLSSFLQLILIKNSLVNFTLLTFISSAHVFSPLILFPLISSVSLFLFTHWLLSLTLLFPPHSSCFLSYALISFHLLQSISLSFFLTPLASDFLSPCLLSLTIFSPFFCLISLSSYFLFSSFLFSSLTSISFPVPSFLQLFPSLLSSTHFLPSPPSYHPPLVVSDLMCRDIPNPVLCPAPDWYCNETYPNIPSSLFLPSLRLLSFLVPILTPLPPVLPEPLSGSLDSVSSHIKRAWRSPRRQDPGTATSAQGGMRGCVWGVLRPLRGEGGHAMLRADVTGTRTAGWGDAAGKERRREGPTPAAQPGERGERRCVSKHSPFCSPFLSSPCSPSPPPALPFDSTIR